MPIHAHLIVAPTGGDGLRATFAEAHRRYTGTINARFRWTGHPFQGRFGAVVMQEPHLLAAARYIVLNPVVAGLVSRAEDWPWLNAGAHLAGEDDELARVTPLCALVPDFAALLAAPARPGDDGPDRARAHHRATAGGAGMDGAARAPIGAPQARAKIPSGAGHRPASPIAMTHCINCHSNSKAKCTGRAN